MKGGFAFLDKVEAFFFRAMRAGYAVEGMLKAKVADMPGYKEIRFEEGDFLLVDRWCVNKETERSAGTTTIWYRNQPVWFMSYGGYYSESSVRFLKEALRTTYEASEFLGGRGPLLYLNDDKSRTYQNFPEQDSYFFGFKGREEIHSQCGRRMLGYHEYWGMSLIRP